MSYDDVIKNFGEPNEVRTEKVLFPATFPPNYNYVGILSYDGIEIS